MCEVKKVLISGEVMRENERYVMLSPNLQSCCEDLYMIVDKKNNQVVTYESMSCFIEKDWEEYNV